MMKTIGKHESILTSCGSSPQILLKTGLFDTADFESLLWFPRGTYQAPSCVFPAPKHLEGRYGQIYLSRRILFLDSQLVPQLKCLL